MTEFDLAAVPRRNPAYEYRDGFLVDTERRAEAVFVNPAAVMVWGMCDGATSIRGIIDDLKAAYPEKEDTVPDDVLAALRKLVDYGTVSVG